MLPSRPFVVFRIPLVPLEEDVVVLDQLRMLVGQLRMRGNAVKERKTFGPGFATSYMIPLDNADAG
jgi:hypothetical protein